MRTFPIKAFIFIISLVWALPAVSFAAEFSLDAAKDSFAPGAEFVVNVYLDTEQASVNALEGSVRFPGDILELVGVSDGGSAVHFWVKRPVAAANPVEFSGIAVGGISGSKNLLFSMAFRARKAGAGTVAFGDDLQVLQNDGIGTKLGAKSRAFSFSVSDGGALIKEDIVLADVDIPETFVPFVTKDPAIFDGAGFLVFSAQDKGSGISHYEVKEGYWGSYIRAESPHLLEDQSLAKNIYVKAVDNRGNERVVILDAPRPSRTYQYAVIIGIIIAICVLVYIRQRHRRARR